MNIVQHIKTLAVESSAPAAVDILDILQNPTTITPSERNNTIDAFVDALVADGTLTVQDASALVEEAKSPFTGLTWETVECNEDDDEF